MNQPLLGNARILDDLVCLKADEISVNGGTNKHCGKSNNSPPPDLQNLALIWKNNGSWFPVNLDRFCVISKAFWKFPGAAAFCGTFSLFSVMRKPKGTKEVSSAI